MNIITEKSALMSAHIQACREAWPQFNQEIEKSSDGDAFAERGICLLSISDKSLYLTKIGTLVELTKYHGENGRWMAELKPVDNLSEAMEFYDVQQCILELQTRLNEIGSSIKDSITRHRTEIDNVKRRWPLPGFGKD